MDGTQLTEVKHPHIVLTSRSATGSSFLRQNRSVTTPRRAATENAQARTQLIDAAERLMLADGYASVTARRVAAEAGVTAPLIHYHFGPLDGLFIAVLRRRAEENLAVQRGLLSGPKPLTALWEFNLATSTVRYISEFMALAHHRIGVREELLDYVRRFHEDAVQDLQAADTEGRINLGEQDVSGLVAILINAARGIAMQRVLGTDEGHDAATAILRGLIDQVEAPAVVAKKGHGGTKRPGRRRAAS